MEKYVENELENILTLEMFNKEFIYYSPSDKILKEIFDKCSKTGNGIGIPDRIFFDGNTLIIFECKWKKLRLAEKDLTHYLKNMKNIKCLELLLFLKLNTRFMNSINLILKKWIEF